MNKRTLRYLRYAVHGKKTTTRRPKRKASSRGPERNWRYRAWIRSLPSAVSGCGSCEAAHTGTDGGMRQKSSDYSCIPLTPAEHREYHRIGKKAFEERHGISCEEISSRMRELWF